MIFKPEMLDRPAYVLGLIEALESVVVAIATHLPERAMYAIAVHARQNAERLEDDVRERQTDPMRDYADAAHDVATGLGEAVDRTIRELKQGATLRTVQPFPIPPGEYVNETDRW